MSKTFTHLNEMLKRLIGWMIKQITLTFITGNSNRLYTKLYDKRDDFNFHIVNFPFLSSDIPSGPSYGVYISQLIRHARCCTCYDDFGYHHKLLDAFLKAIKSTDWEIIFKNSMAGIQMQLQNIRSQLETWWMIRSPF